jgi:hypothetical protein
MVEIASSAGSVKAPAIFDTSWLRAVVSLPHGLGRKACGLGPLTAWEQVSAGAATLDFREMNANMLTDTRRTVACDGLSEGAARLAPLSQWSIEDRGVGAGRSMTGLA